MPTQLAQWVYLWLWLNSKRQFGKILYAAELASAVGDAAAVLGSRSRDGCGLGASAAGSSRVLRHKEAPLFDFAARESGRGHRTCGRRHRVTSPTGRAGGVCR